ncbi:MAG TPA: sigma-70 family RNA polymerase sigma factor [Polyangia bacterium]
MRFSLTNDERNQLIVRHLDSVHAAANTFKVQPWIRDELISAGYEALVLASTRFDPSSNATFSTFAYRPVLGAMYDLLDNYKLWSTRHRPHGIHHDDPTNQARSQRSGDDSLPPHCPDYEHASLTFQVLAAVDRLPPAAAEIINAHFLQEQTLSCAGARLGISKTRLSVHVTRAIQLLREQLDDGLASWPDSSPRSKRRYSKEYRAALVRRALQPCANHSQLSREFNVPPSTLLTWLKPFRQAVQQGALREERAA